MDKKDVKIGVQTIQVCKWGIEWIKLINIKDGFRCKYSNGLSHLKDVRKKGCWDNSSKLKYNWIDSENWEQVMKRERMKLAISSQIFLKI